MGLPGKRGPLGENEGKEGGQRGASRMGLVGPMGAAAAPPLAAPSCGFSPTWGRQGGWLPSSSFIKEGTPPVFSQSNSLSSLNVVPVGAALGVGNSLL